LSGVIDHHLSLETPAGRGGGTPVHSGWFHRVHILSQTIKLQSRKYRRHAAEQNNRTFCMKSDPFWYRFSGQKLE